MNFDNLSSYVTRVQFGTITSRLTVDFDKLPSLCYLPMNFGILCCRHGYCHFTVHTMYKEEHVNVPDIRQSYLIASNVNI